MYLASVAEQLQNGVDVGIPGTRKRGSVFAAAPALVIGKPDYALYTPFSFLSSPRQAHHAAASPFLFLPSIPRKIISIRAITLQDKRPKRRITTLQNSP